MTINKNKYKYLDQFYKNNFIVIKDVIKQDVNIADCGSVDVLIVEKDNNIITINKGYSASRDKAIEQDNTNKILLTKSDLLEITNLL
jgi:hypothetical protein